MRTLRAYLVSVILTLAWAMPTTMVAPHVAYAQAASCVTSGGRIIIIGGKAVCFPPSTNACPVTVGGLTLNAVVAARSAGVSPFLEFFDATGTTSTVLTGNTTAFQDINYAWIFGDSGASGTGTWLYGANPGVNSMNTATGAIAAHLYRIPDGSGDTNFVATVVATDGTNTASCNIGVTAQDASGANGFPGTTTTCVAASSTPVPGSGGCPAGAAVSTTSNFNTAISSFIGNGKRLLFNCGDTFTGDNASVTAVKASIGAYGSCIGTQSGNPILSDTTPGSGSSDQSEIAINSGAGDVRIADIFFQNNSRAAPSGAVTSQVFITQNIPYQITMWNLQETAGSYGFSWTMGAQWGAIQTATLAGVTGLAFFINQDENNPASMFGTFPNINYTAILGNFVNGVGAAGGTGAGVEPMRTSACRLCTYTNNTVQNANTGGGVFKMHNGNTFQSCGGGATGGSCQAPCTVGGEFANVNCWTGQYTELIEISDNLFTGNSGGILSDIAPENGAVDERLRNIVIERNLYNSPTGGEGDTLLLVTGANITLRDNVFEMPGTELTHAGTGVIVAQRGTGPIESGTIPLPPVQFNEAYNNTCYAPNTIANQQCIGYDTSGATATATANSFASNNMFYVPTTATGPTVHNTGTGNTVSNNTVTVTNNPGFTDGSGSFIVISDFKPTANFTISCTPFPSCTKVPVQTDALSVTWPPTWDLGAVHH